MKRLEENDIRIENAEDRSPPSCCICWDVRTGTILIGIFLLVVYSGSFILASSAFSGHRSFYKENLAKHLSILSDFQHMSHHYSVDHEMIGMIFVCLYIFVILLLICGAALRRSSYMLPFLCLQVFDICVTILVAATTIKFAGQILPKLNEYYLVHHKGHDHYGVFMRKMSVSRFRLLLVTVNLIILSIKYFMIMVVWSFFKYCRSHEERRSRVVEATPNYMIYQGNMDSMIILPTYEDALKQKAAMPPPPAYAQ